MKVSVVTIDLVRNDFPRIAGRLDKGVSNALDLGVATAVEVADPLTRRDTGDLVGNKVIEVGSEHRVIHWTMEYAAYQNFGTYKMEGTHFADEGADAGYERLIAELKGIF